MTRYGYTLCILGRHFSKRIATVAVEDRGALLEMFQKKCPDALTEWRVEANEWIAKLLKRSDEDLAKDWSHSGAFAWGGSADAPWDSSGG